MFIGGVLVGTLFDDGGPAYLLAFGTFLHVLGLILTSVSTTYVQILLCQGVVSAFGSCMLLFPAVSCVSPSCPHQHPAPAGVPPVRP
jgi:FtsH-binding integral membrane protein